MNFEKITKEQLIEEYNQLYQSYKFAVERSIKIKQKLDETIKVANKLSAKNIELNLLLQAKVERIKKNDKKRIWWINEG